MNLIKKLSHKIHHEYYLTAEQLGCYRIFYCFALVTYVGFLNPYSVSEIPTFMYTEVYGVASLFKGFPSDGVWYTLCVLHFLSFVFMFVGFKTKYSSLLYAILTMVLKNFIEGYMWGAGRHIIYDLVPLFMAFSGWGNCYSFDSIRSKKEPISGAPIFFVAFALCFAVFSAGVPKFESGWLKLGDQAIYWHIVKKNIARGADLFLIKHLVSFGELKIWEVFDYLVVFFELTIIIAFLKKGVLKFYISLLCFFHLGVVLSLNIGFASISLVYMLFIIEDINLKNKFDFILKKVSSLKLVILIAVIMLIPYLIFVSENKYTHFSYLGFLIWTFIPNGENGIGGPYFFIGNCVSLFMWLCYCTLVSWLYIIPFLKQKLVKVNNTYSS